MNRFLSIEICVFGEQIERFLNLCSYHNIKFYDVKILEDKYYASIYAYDFRKLKTFAKKTSVKCKLMKKSGYYFKVKAFMKRKVFLYLPIICLLLLLLSSNYLWDVSLVGNQSITTDMVRDFLQAEGVSYGMSLEKIPIQRLKTNFRKLYPQVTWVSMYLEGTTLKISMKEHENTKLESKTESFGENLVAPISGIVDAILLRKGTLQVQEGMKVNKGDILILGKVEVPAEDGSIKSVSYIKADGDIFLRYVFPVKEELTLKYLAKEYTGNVIQKYEIVFPTNKAEMTFKKVPFETYDMISEEINISLISILSLPIKIYKNSYYEYNNVEKKYSLKEAQNLLELKFVKILESLEEKGVQIIEKNVKIKSNSVQAALEGNLLLRIKCDEYETLEEDS